MIKKEYPEIPSKEFLDELVERSRRLGWGCDYTELSNIVEEFHRQAGIEFEMPDVYETSDPPEVAIYPIKKDVELF